jgi:hypothetical protein
MTTATEMTTSIGGAGPDPTEQFNRAEAWKAEVEARQRRAYEQLRRLQSYGDRADKADEIAAIEATLPAIQEEQARTWEACRRARESLWQAALFALAEKEALDLLQRFHTSAASFFSTWTAGRTSFPSRPQVGLRLVADGKPGAMLVALPYWSQGTKAIDPSRLDCEWMSGSEEPGYMFTGWDFRRGFKLEVSLGWTDLRRCPGTIIGDIGRMLATMRDYLADDRAVFARGSPGCCICGKLLSDEKSRSRGVGPDCWQKMLRLAHDLPLFGRQTIPGSIPRRRS